MHSHPVSHGLSNKLITHRTLRQNPGISPCRCRRANCRAYLDDSLDARPWPGR